MLVRPGAPTTGATIFVVAEAAARGTAFWPERHAPQSSARVRSSDSPEQVTGLVGLWDSCKPSALLRLQVAEAKRSHFVSLRRPLELRVRADGKS